MRESQNFTVGKLFFPIIRFALPVLAAMLLQTMYGAVDMMIVGNYASAADVSAISTGSWVMIVVTSIVMGISVGTSVLLGHTTRHVRTMLKIPNSVTLAPIIPPAS